MKASKLLDQAREWLGKNKRDGSHREIIDIYNTQRPLPRGYALTYRDFWCAAFISALAVKCGCVGVIPTECSCPRMIGFFQKMGRWDENDGRVPNLGDIIFYDWNDRGTGDDRGSAEHVGIVEAVSGGRITVIEGNYHDAVGRRTISVNGRYIRGYGLPEYEKETAPKEVYTQDAFIREVQSAIGAAVDGKVGPETLRKLPTVSRYRNRLHPVILPVQKKLKQLGFYKGELDGHAWKLFDQAVKDYQKSIGNPNIDGELTAGQRTWRHLLV